MLKDRDVNFFRPLWRRIAVTAVCVVWAAIEATHGDQLWIAITVGLTAYAVWTFFIRFPKEVPADPAPAEAKPIENREDDDVPPSA
jgi:hypothetical protein